MPSLPPLPLSGEAPRSWEGWVRLEERGFLLVTDSRGRDDLWDGLKKETQGDVVASVPMNRMGDV